MHKWRVGFRQEQGQLILPSDQEPRKSVWAQLQVGVCGEPVEILFW